MKTSSLYVKRITMCAVLLSISLILKTTFSFYIPLFGQNGISISLSGIFSVMPSILFGPIYGAIVSGLSDLLGYLLKPNGVYLPLMTLVMAFGGFIRGVLWILLRSKNALHIRVIISICSVLLLITGVCNIYFLSVDGMTNEFYNQSSISEIQTEDMHAVSRMLIARTISTKNPSGNLATYIICVTYGLVGSSILGLFLAFADFLMSKMFFHGACKGQIPQLLTAMVVSGLIVTTLNTIILREMLYTSWKNIPFMIIWIPRAIEEILGNTVKTYFAAILLGIFKKTDRQHFPIAE